MPAIVHCEACGKETYRDLLHCPDCGAALPGAAPPQPQSAASPHPLAEFRIGAVLSGGFSIYFGNIVRFGTLGVILLSPLLLLEWLMAERGLGLVQARSPMQAFTFMDFIHLILSLMLFSVLTASITYGTFQALRGREVRVGDCLSWGFSRVFPVVGVSIVAGLAAFLAAAAVIVPGMLVASPFSFFGILFMIGGGIAALLIMLRYWVAVPATVVERNGVFDSLGRSVGLTRGCRGYVFIVALVYLILYFVFIFCVEFAVGLGARMAPSLGMAITMVLVVSFIANALAQAFGSVLTCVCYYELRRSKEGVDAQEIAAVFD